MFNCCNKNNKAKITKKTQENGLFFQFSFRDDTNQIQECSLWEQVFQILNIFESEKDNKLLTNLVPVIGSGCKSNVPPSANNGNGHYHEK